MELASLIISIAGALIGIIGIVVSIYCWRHTWKEIDALGQMRKNNFSQEEDFAKFNNDAITHIREGGKNPFQSNGNLLNDMKTALYNMLLYINNKSGDA